MLEGWPLSQHCQPIKSVLLFKEIDWLNHHRWDKNLWFFDSSWLLGVALHSRFEVSKGLNVMTNLLTPVHAKALQSCPPLCNMARLLCPWDFPGKNTGVGCHFLLQEPPCTVVKSDCSVSLTLCWRQRVSQWPGYSLDKQRGVTLRQS